MYQIHVYLLIIAPVLGSCLVEGYRTFSMRDLKSCSNKSIEINLSSMTWNSSGILVSALENTYEPGLHCEIILKPHLAYGIAVSIRFMDLQPYALNQTECENYLEISKLGRSDAVRLCGYSDDEYEFKSYLHWGTTQIVFHTSNSSNIHRAKFQLTFTSIRKGNNWCFSEERRCHSGHCIWKGLACDGHNNCGDLSDELDKFVSQCGVMSSGESLAVILVTIVGSLILLFVAAYLKGPKLTEQIERLSGTRSTPSTSAQTQSTESNSNVLGSNTTVPTISSRRSNYGSTARYPDSYYNAVIHDPPPSYDEVQNLPVYSVQRAVTIERSSENIYRS